jgi:glycosyltransferase involved in cell wall biosynthesis
MKRVLFLVPYPAGMAASQRFRFEQYLDILTKNGYSFTISSFLSKSAFSKWYREGGFIWKAFQIFLGLIRRAFDVLRSLQYDYVFVHREVVPVGPPILEFILAKIFRKKIIYDFDDAIWIPNASESNRFFMFFKFYSSVKILCKWAYKVSCGNSFLCSFAKLLNDDVVYNPTTIDTDNHHNIVKHDPNDKLVVGWTGSHSTVRYIELLFPIIERLMNHHDFRFVLISDLPPDNCPPFVEFIKWNKETEIRDLGKLDIGLMPLEDDRWAKGKCGFKALQYLSLGIPALVSPVGVNTKIVDHGINGFVCKNDEEWFMYLEQLLKDRSLLKKLSASTRSKVEQEYSVRSNSSNFLNLFTEKNEEYSTYTDTSGARR